MMKDMCVYVHVCACAGACYTQEDHTYSKGINCVTISLKYDGTASRSRCDNDPILQKHMKARGTVRWKLKKLKVRVRKGRKQK